MFFLDLSEKWELQYWSNWKTSPVGINSLFWVTWWKISCLQVGSKTLRIIRLVIKLVNSDTSGELFWGVNDLQDHLYLHRAVILFTHLSTVGYLLLKIWCWIGGATALQIGLEGLVAVRLIHKTAHGKTCHEVPAFGPAWCCCAHCKGRGRAAWVELKALIFCALSLFPDSVMGGSALFSRTMLHPCASTSLPSAACCLHQGVPCSNSRGNGHQEGQGKPCQLSSWAWSEQWSWAELTENCS